MEVHMKWRWKYEGAVLANSNVLATHWRGDVEAETEEEAIEKFKNMILKMIDMKQHIRIYFNKRPIKMEAVASW